jgi:hypothetical protein
VALKQTRRFSVASGAVVALCGAAACGGSNQQTTTTTRGNSTVVSEALDRYNDAKQNGTGIDMCVRAREVAAAYLQVKDEDNYKIWKETESTDCGAVGMRPQG